MKSLEEFQKYMNKKVDQSNKVLLSGLLIGMSKSDFKKYADNNNLDYRIVEEDGVAYMCTCDCIPYRLNISLKDDIIIKVDLG